ncbi:non-heme chloroperoxidase [Cadophora sp. MPI-SDFR-AT-0126]|nr:non-heme chloroperoxidase [Leotiomycetes sp. MPI-SDFR-AT-0126]
MPFVTTKDKTEIFYKDWGNPTGKPVVFSHGWPLNSDNWENQMYFLANHGYRVIAHDRRGHGRSSQPWEGNDLNTWTDDLLAVFEHLDLKDVMLVGHSTGGAEVTRFLARHGTSRVSKAVLVGAVPVRMLRKEGDPDGLDISHFDGIRAGIIANRAQLFIDIPTGPFFGYNLPGATPSQGLIDSWYQQGMLCSLKAVHDTVVTWQEDFTEDLKTIDIPVLLLHGELDQIVPIKPAAQAAVKILKNATLKVFPGGAHALPNTAADEVNEDLLKFLQS